ncbi:MAG: TlpA family protein disulfide reductase [Prolixibacteraceae bacterium]|nr:TlpA family protein disulfide reductase [Prolixibacteraceae bacterium]
MKKLQLLFIAFCIISFANATTLNVKLTTSEETPQANYGLGIVKYAFEHEFWKECDTMFISENGEFKFELKDGMYILFMNHPYCDEYYYHVRANGQREIKLEAALNPLSIHQEIKHISINGEFNNYGNNTFLEYDENEKVYKLPDSLMDLQIESFYFKLNDKQQLHTNRLPRKEYDVQHSLSNINKKGNESIVFDPGEYGFVDTTGSPENVILDLREYKNWIIKPTVKAKKEVEEFDELCHGIKEINKALWMAYYELAPDYDLETYKDIYKKQIKRNNQLKEKFTSEPNMFLLPDYYIASQFDTTYIEYYIHAVNRRNTEASEIRKSDAFITYKKNEAIALKNLLENGSELPGQILSRISPYTDLELFNFGLLDEVRVPYGYFYNFFIEYEKNTTDPEIGGNILFNQARTIERSNPSKALEIIMKLKKKYPTYSGLQNSEVDNFMNKFSVIEGFTAPDFELVSLDNKKLKLSDFKGKFVFIDFWGIWCGPCRSEIPNVKKLSETFTEDQLVVIGISTRDTEEDLREFIKENEIKYQNALSDNKVNIDYGVNSYPTTFLIDKEGKIIAKNLRGPDLTEMVKGLIKY